MFPHLFLLLPPPLLLSSDCLSHLCWPSAFLLLGCLLLDVSGGCATLSHAGGSLWKRILPQKVLLSVRLLLPRTRGGHLCGHRLQELWDKESVRVKTDLLHLQIEKEDYAIPPAGNVICSAVWTALAPPCGLAFLNTLSQSLMISLHKIIRWDREILCVCVCAWVWVWLCVTPSSPLCHSRCWLRVDNYFIWSFIGPVSFVIMVLALLSDIIIPLIILI